MWFLLQSFIIFAVEASNIRWHWTPNGYVASLIAIGVAFATTAIANELLMICKRFFTKRRARQQRISKRLEPIRRSSSAQNLVT